MKNVFERTTIENAAIFANELLRQIGLVKVDNMLCALEVADIKGFNG